MMRSTSIDARPKSTSPGRCSTRVRSSRAADHHPYSTASRNVRDAGLPAAPVCINEANVVVIQHNESWGNRTAPGSSDGGGFDLPAPDAPIELVDISRPPRNVAVTHAEYGEGIEGGQVLVRVSNFGPDPIEVACEVVLPDGRVEAARDPRGPGWAGVVRSDPVQSPAGRSPNDESQAPVPHPVPHPAPAPAPAPPGGSGGL